MADYALYHGDCLDVMAGLPNESVDLVVTSPPYNLDVDYGEVTDRVLDYVEWFCGVSKEIKRLLVPGGRFCLNLPAHTSRTLGGFDVFDVVQGIKSLGLSLRATHIWHKPNHVGSAARGSICSPSCPVSQPNYEFVFFFDNGWKRTDRSGRSEITGKEFMEFTQGTWSFSPVMKINQKGQNTLGHPVPFPEELPRRCILLHSWPGDVVLDPFLGSGTTGVVAGELKRDFIGIEKNLDYFNMAKNRVEGVYLQPSMLDGFIE